MAATSLPLEILVLIMDGWDTKSLLKIRLVSRSWYKAAMCAMADYVRGLFAEVSYNYNPHHSIRGFPYPPTVPPTYTRTPKSLFDAFFGKPEESRPLGYEHVYLSFHWEWSTPGQEHTMLVSRAGSVPLPPQGNYSQVVPIVMEAWISFRKHRSDLRLAFNQSNNSFDYEHDDDVIIARGRKVDHVHCSSQGFRLPNRFVNGLNLAPEMTIVCRRESGNWFMECMEFKL